MTAGRELLLFFLAIIVIAGNGIVVCNPSMPQFSSSPASNVPRSAPKGPFHRIINGRYWPSWLAEKFPPSKIPTKYFTHLFYAFVVPDAMSYQLFNTRLDDRRMGNFTATIHAKKPPTKALLSIGGGTSSLNTFSNMASNGDNRADFIKSSTDVARKYGFDGLGLDWEFPIPQQDKSNVLMLFYEWRTAIDKESLASGKPRLLLSAAIYFASNLLTFSFSSTNLRDSIREYFDFVNPMCYDYHGSWDHSVTGSQASLFDKSNSISPSHGISTGAENGAPLKKLVTGSTMYGRTGQLKDLNGHGIGALTNRTTPGNGGIMCWRVNLILDDANDSSSDKFMYLLNG